MAVTLQNGSEGDGLGGERFGVGQRGRRVRLAPAVPAAGRGPVTGGGRRPVSARSSSARYAGMPPARASVTTFAVDAPMPSSRVSVPASAIAASSAASTARMTSAARRNAWDL